MDFFKRKELENGVILNEIQKQAVEHEEGRPLLLLASPGSGKTTTMIMRIGYLLEEFRVSPERILAVTFSRASASDMTNRYNRLFPNAGYIKPTFSTIHSLAFEIVRDWMRENRIDYEVIEGNQLPKKIPHKSKILSDLYRKHTGEWITEDIREQMSGWISYIKNKMIPEKDIQSVAPEFNGLKEIFIEYEEIKLNHLPRLLDYDDMLTVANQILEENDALLNKYQSRYDHVLTDESQDTSIVQHEIIEKLASKHLNLFVVGDDDQSIYSWRGSALGVLLNFEAIYPTARILFMEQNYRSSMRIVQTANEFIKRNKNRYPKNMFTENEVGADIQIEYLFSYPEQLKRVLKLVQNESNLSEVAILYRNTSSMVPIMHYLHENGIPFYQKDKDNRFFKHFIIEDLKNYFRLSYDDTVIRANFLEDIGARFRGYLTKQQIKAMKAFPDDYSIWDALLSQELKHYQRIYIQKAKQIVPKLKGMKATEALLQLRYELEYENALSSYAKFTNRSSDQFYQVLDTIQRIADGLPSVEALFKKLDEIEEVMRQSVRNQGRNVVTLSTFHSSKGLEFDNVIMIDLQNDVVPNFNDMEAFKLGNVEPLEESARLFYVGMTRARKNLILINHGGKGNASIFMKDVENILKGKQVKLKEVKKKETPPSEPEKIVFIQYQLGKIVEHKKFGNGEIVNLTEDQITINFSGKLKTLDRKFCLMNGILKEPKEQIV